MHTVTVSKKVTKRIFTNLVNEDSLRPYRILRGFLFYIMEVIKKNGCELPITKKYRYVSSYSLMGAKYSFINDGESEVLNIETDYNYKTNYYFNLYDSKGNVFNESKHTEQETITKKLSVKEIDSFSFKNIVLYIDNEFRLLTIDNRRIYTIDELNDFNRILNTKYKTYSDVNWNKINVILDFLPKYNIIRGHSREIFGLLSRDDIKMTYKELKSKIKNAKKDYKDKINYDLDEDFINMENEIIKGISKYLMLTPKQYKAGRYNLIKQLNKRLNYNINNKK